MKNLILVIILLLLGSCASHKKVTETPVVITQEHTKYTSTESKDSILLNDSIYIHDSIYVREKGDTVYYYKTKIEYKYKTQDKYITRTDTLCLKDSIPYPVTVVKYQEVTTNKLSWLQQTLVYLGIAALIVLLAIIISKYIKLYFKK